VAEVICLMDVDGMRKVAASIPAVSAGEEAVHDQENCNPCWPNCHGSVNAGPSLQLVG
jgi:hypothetical protein